MTRCHHRLRLRAICIPPLRPSSAPRARSENPEKISVTRDPDAVFRADRIVLPGVGAFADCRRGVDALDGMLEALTEAVRSKARPFFGICVGMQLMATRGKEHVVTDGFNWIEGDVVKIQPRDENLKVPHMGWNTLDMVQRASGAGAAAARDRKAATPISCTPITSPPPTRRMCWRAPIMAGRSPPLSARTPRSARNSTRRRASASASP